MVTKKKWKKNVKTAKGTRERMGDKKPGELEK